MFPRMIAASKACVFIPWFMAQNSAIKEFCLEIAQSTLAFTLMLNVIVTVQKSGEGAISINCICVVSRVFIESSRLGRLRKATSTKKTNLYFSY